MLGRPGDRGVPGRRQGQGRVVEGPVEQLAKAARGEATDGHGRRDCLGNSEFVDADRAQARRHGQEELKTGAVLTVSAGALQAMANDAEVGALTGDGEMRSQLAIATEIDGRGGVWAGEIAKIGAVIGRGVGVAIVDSGVDNHTALAGRIWWPEGLHRRSNRTNGDQYGHGTHVAGIVAAGAPKKDTGEAPVGHGAGRATSSA